MMSEDIRYTPAGVSSTSHIQHDISTLLGHVRQKTSVFEYVFDAVLDTSLHRGSVVTDYRAHTQKSDRHSAPRKGLGTVVTTPYHLDFLQPPSKKSVLVQWNYGESKNERLTYLQFDSSEKQYEEKLRKRILKTISTKNKSNFDVHLQGNMLTVYSLEYDDIVELHSCVSQLCNTISELRQTQDTLHQTRTEFWESPQSTKPHAQVYTAKESNIPANRKMFTRKMRTDSTFTSCADDNIAKHAKKSVCNQLQPHDCVGQNAIVPHWSTKEEIHKYIEAKCLSLHDDGMYMTVQKNTHTWQVPVYHTHPTSSCQNVRRGSKVFVTSHREPSEWAVMTVRAIHLSNHILDCGYAGEKSKQIVLPIPFSIPKWNEAIQSQFHGVTVSIERGTSKIIFRTQRPRFTLWSSSTCMKLLGFDNVCNYETSNNIETKTYELISPRKSNVTDHTIFVETHLELCEDDTRLNDTKYDAPVLPLPQCIPVRPTYSKDSSVFAHPSAYQSLPRRFLTSERPSRGLLLFHEMGSGKSRTSIDMAQQNVEDLFWNGMHEAPSQPLSFGLYTPPVVLLSPTQEARNHFKEDCAVWLAPHWTFVLGNCVPVQHMYRAFDVVALQSEIQQHQKRVQRFVQKKVLFPIVYTNNTNNLFSVLRSFRKGVLKKRFTHAEKASLKLFFHRSDDDTTFDFDKKHITDDELYSRLFSNSFVIIDEMHNLCNSISLATENAQGEHDSGCGTFFYRAFMEAVNCKIVGLSGTPMQRTPLAMAPMFNLLKGKQVVCQVHFSDALSNYIKENIFAHLRPYMETILSDVKQSNGKRIAFVAHQYSHLIPVLQHTLDELQKKHKEVIVIERKDVELFPFAFKYRSTTNTLKKYYAYDNGSNFMKKYVKHGRINNADHFLMRVIGLISYISPPKQTHSATSRHTSKNVNDEYPEYNIHTVYVASTDSHMAYLQSIMTRKKEINQRQADIEQRSGCNVNWSVVPSHVLNGKKGLLKLFFKGGSTSNDYSHTQQYHQLLQKVHTQFANVQDNKEIADCLDIHKKLVYFSPKLHSIASSLIQNLHKKAVVYSDFIDGIGKFSNIEPSSSVRPAPQMPFKLDEKHVGLSGLGLLGYVLEHNGFVRLRVQVHHPLQSLHQRIWKLFENTRDVVMSLGFQRIRNTKLLTYEELVSICENLNVPLSEEQRESLADDIHWSESTVRVCDVCRSCFMQDKFSPNFMMQSVRYRLSIDPHTRRQLALDVDGIVKGPKKHVFVEYSDRCVSNVTSKRGLQFAKQAVLHLYNLKKEEELITMNVLTPQAIRDFHTLMHRNNSSHHVPTTSLSVSPTSHRHRNTTTQKSVSKRKRRTRKSSSTTTIEQSYKDNGNAYGLLIQTLFVSMSVTEGVEFKDVRTLHVLEPPTDYRKLEQIFGRVIRRGSHAGLHERDRSVQINMYILSSSHSLLDTKSYAVGQPKKSILTADEHYWGSVIRRKYEISQEFYHLMKYGAIDCRHNLVLNSASFQDKMLTCFEYPYQENLQDWAEREAILFSPLEDIEHFTTKRGHTKAIHLGKVEEMVRANT